MAHQVQGVVSESRGAPVKLTTINVPDPGPGEALVRVQACGVCHTDLHYREGAINDDFPFLLGHEAAGVVESVGPDVDNVAPGDFVIIAWRAPCSNCRSCVRGRPWYCFASRNAAQPMTLADGTPLSPALGIGAFTELTLVAAGQAVKVPSDASAAAAGERDTINTPQSDDRVSASSTSRTMASVRSRRSPGDRYAPSRSLAPSGPLKGTSAQMRCVLMAGIWKNPIDCHTMSATSIPTQGGDAAWPPKDLAYASTQV